MLNLVLEAIGFFLPHLGVAALLSLLFGMTNHGQFKETPKPVSEDAIGVIQAMARATSFFATFAVFGIVVGYFISLGLQEGETDLSNTLLGAFATPLIALLTAGVGYFARKGAPKAAVTIVAAGLTCFLIESVVSYRAFYLDSLS